MTTRRTFLALSAAAARPLFGLASPPVTAPLAAGNTRFGLDLYGRLAATPGNVFFSPFSVSTALAMTGAGAKGDTLAEFRTVLRLPQGEQATHAGFAELLAGVNGDGNPAKRAFELISANALWAQAGYPWRPEYVTAVKGGYGAAVRDVDYRNPEAARGTINAWVEAQTKNKIKDLMAKGTVSVDTRLVLTNAVYFKGVWAVPFPTAATADGDFHVTAADAVKVPLMRKQAQFRLLETADFQALSLPYKGNDLSMVVVLPRTADGLPGVEKALGAADGGEWFGRAAAARIENVKVTLPRFTLATAYTLNDPLKALGLTKAFDDRAADFSGMASGGEKLAISVVAHKAFVDVNEEGTEAAAATGVAVGVRSAMPREPKVFTADRPFLFAIRHDPTGSVLFLGRVVNPKG